MKLAPDYWSVIAEDERTATLVALFTKLHGHRRAVR
jgi:sarcosine oxidase gamma subunit